MSNVHEPEVSQLASASAEIKSHALISSDGSTAETLSVFCPSCAAWHEVQDARSQWRSTEVLRAHDRLLHSEGWNERNTPLAQVMTRHVVCVRPDYDASLLPELLLERGIGCLPVIAEGDALVGIITKSDVLRALGRPPPSKKRPLAAGDVMTPFAFTLPADAEVARAAALMAHEGLEHLVVVAPDGATVAGIVAGADLLRWLAVHAGFVVPRPERKAPPPPPPRATHVLTPASQPKPPARHRREVPADVLVVDDDRDLREALVALLDEEGYVVTAAANGAEALQLLENAAPPALVLLDLQMPVMDGWTLHSEMKKRSALENVPLVLLSGQQDLEKEVRRLHAKGSLMKPLASVAVLDLVESLCD